MTEIEVFGGGGSRRLWGIWSSTDKPEQSNGTPVTPYPPAPPQVDDDGNLTEDVHTK